MPVMDGADLESSKERVRLCRHAAGAEAVRGRSVELVVAVDGSVVWECETVFSVPGDARGHMGVNADYSVGALAATLTNAKA